MADAAEHCPLRRRLRQPSNQAGNVMPMNVRSLPAMLRASARLQPNDTAYTFIDYEQDSAGVAQNLTWSQLYRRTLNVARELSSCASTGDRVVISAPQGIPYILGFLGALQAGLVAVPLSVPLGGATDDRFDSVLRDASPVAVLTTSSVVDDVAQHVTPQPGTSAPSVIEVDSLDLDSPNASGAGDENHPATAYLQYTSGSTRTPAGVIMSHQNLRANIKQLMPELFARYGWDRPAGSDAGLVAAVLSRHGFSSGSLWANPVGMSGSAHQPDVVPTAPGPVDGDVGQHYPPIYGSTELRL